MAIESTLSQIMLFRTHDGGLHVAFQVADVIGTSNINAMETIARTFHGFDDWEAGNNMVREIVFRSALKAIHRRRISDPRITNDIIELFDDKKFDEYLFNTYGAISHSGDM